MRGLALLAALGLGACAMEGASPEGGAAAVAPVRAVSAPEALAQRLPSQAAGFQRGATVPTAQPLPGVEVAYATPSRVAAAFVQVLRPPSAVTDGTGSPAVEEEFQRSIADAARGSGPHRRLRVVREANQPARSPLLRCAELEGTYGRQPVQSTICVGAAGGQLLRLRVSMPRRDPAPADTRAFLAEIVAALRATP